MVDYDCHVQVGDGVYVPDPDHNHRNGVFTYNVTGKEAIKVEVVDSDTITQRAVVNGQRKYAVVKFCIG